MKIIYHSNVCPKGYSGIYLFGLLFVRGGYVSDRMRRHELTHERQAIEMLFIFFYLWYVIEWFIRLFRKGNAYRNISFEREAYMNEYNSLYLKQRRFFAFLKYLKKK